MMYYERTVDLAKKVGCGELKAPRLCPAGYIPYFWASAFLEEDGRRMRYGCAGDHYWRNIEHSYPSHGYVTWPE